MFNSLSNTQKGMFWALFGYSAFALSDASVKWLTIHYSIWQIIAVDTGLSALFILSLAPWLAPKSRIFEVHRPAIHILRTVMNFLISILIVHSFARLPLVSVYTIVFTKPFFVVLLAILIYREKITFYRLIAIIAGFAGIVIATQPEIHNLDFWLFLPVLVAFFAALMFVVSRSLEKESVFALGFYPALGTSLLSIPFMLADFKMPGLFDFMIFAASGLSITGGLIGLSIAFRMAPGSAVGPFHYIQMLWGLGLGYMVFGDLPDKWMILGAGIIIASGLYLMARESRNRAQ